MLIKQVLPVKTRRFLRRILAAPGRYPYWLATSGLYTSENLRRLLALKDKHKGQRGFVLGSGPSLKEMDLTPLRNEITFVSNAFYLALNEVGFTPTYHTVEDPLPAEDNAAALNALEGTTKIFAHDLRYCLKPTPNTIYVFFDRYYSDYPRADFPRFSADAARPGLLGRHRGLHAPPAGLLHGLAGGIPARDRPELFGP